VKSLIIAGTPRTGGNLLAVLLAAAHVGAPDEYHAPHVRAAHGIDHDDPEPFWHVHPGDVYAVKLHPNEIVRYPWGPASLADAHHPDSAPGDRLVVFQTRRDKVAQAVSWYLADRTGVWRDGDQQHESVPPYDAAAIRRFVAQARAWERWWRRRFLTERVAPHEVEHSAFLSDPQAAVAEIARRLDVEPDPLPLLVPPSSEPSPFQAEARAMIDRYQTESAR
jgi:LPS sulfotransferase NodH